MRVSDEWLRTNARSVWRDDASIARELLAARAVVEAAQRHVTAMGACDNLSAEDDWTTSLCAEPGCTYCDLARALGDEATGGDA